MTHAFYTSISKVPKDCWKLLYDALPWEERKRKACRFRFQDDRRRCIAAGALLKFLLEQWTADGLVSETACNVSRSPESNHKIRLSPESVQDDRYMLTMGEYGKPALFYAQGCDMKSFSQRVNAVQSADRNGQSLPGSIMPEVLFNLSHSGDYAVCAIGDVPVGVDVQCPEKNQGDLAAYFFTGAEQQWIAQAGDPDDEIRRFTRIWTRKESYLKLLGIGLNMELDSFEVIPGQEAKGLRQKVFFREFSLPGGIVSVCSPEEIADDLREITFL